MILDYMNIGKRIKDARIERKMKQSELADELGISVAFMSRVERGRSKINLERLVQISEILDKCPAQLLSGINCEKKDFVKDDFILLLGRCNLRQKELIYKISELVIKIKL